MIERSGVNLSDEKEGALSAGLKYFERSVKLLESLRERELGNIERAAEICTESIANGGLVFLFGAGHSAMMCEEMTPRQGCYVGWVALVEHALSNHTNIVGTNGLRGPLYLEKYEGYGEEILKGFAFGPHDAMVVISTSGIRPLIVDVAMGAKQRGLPVVGIVARAHSDAVKATHSSGKKLTDAADVVIDNQCPPGDCVVEIEGLDWKTGPVSTVTGSMIINMLRCEVAERLMARGVKPAMLPSHQFVGNVSAEAALEEFYEAYRKSLRHLYE